MSSEMQMPSSRYVLPSFVEHSAFGAKESNPYNKLFEERIIFLGTQVDDASANDIMAQLLVLEGQDPDRDITMYINSPGGSFTSLMAIYDTMQYVRPDVQTVCLGQAASAAAVLLAAGAPGKRAALPNARVLIHQPATGGVQCLTWRSRPKKLSVCASSWRRPWRGTQAVLLSRSVLILTAIRSSPPLRLWIMESSIRSLTTVSSQLNLNVLLFAVP